MLVALHGQRKAARIAGLNENTVRSWKHRYGWFAPERNRRAEQTKPITVQPIGNSAPVDAYLDELQDCKRRSHIALARYNSSATEDAAAHNDKLAITSQARDLAAIHKSVWPDEPKPNSILNLSVVCGLYQPRETPAQAQGEEHLTSIE